MNKHGMTKTAHMRRRWIPMLAIGVVALAGVYGLATASAVESGDTVQFLIPADANQPTPSNDGRPEDFLVYHSVSGTVDARGCVFAGDRPVQSATLVDPGQQGQHVGNPTFEVITTYTTAQSHDVTTPVEPGTRVGNLLFVTDCSIFVGDTRIEYKKYTGTVR